MLPRLGISDSPQYLPCRFLFPVMYDNINIRWWVCLLLIYRNISNSMYIPICKTLKPKETSKMKFEKPWFDIQHRQDNYLFSGALKLTLGSSQLPGHKAARVWDWSFIFISFWDKEWRELYFHSPHAFYSCMKPMLP
jgi:hypothetical protein